MAGRDSIAGVAMRQGRVSTFVVLLASALVLLLSATALALEELSQKAGTAGCISEDGTEGACQDGFSLSGASGVAASPDGKNVYVASFLSGSVSVFNRDAASGALTEESCVSQGGAGGCAAGNALSGANSVAVSPDGASVYVSVGPPTNALAIFDRDPATGGLTQKPGTAGCISADGTGGACRMLSTFTNLQDVAVSPDGANVYVASNQSNAILVLNRDASGALTPAASGCVSLSGGAPCSQGDALSGPFAIAVSADGRSVYAASIISGGIAILDRDAGGGLTEKPGTAGCITDDGTFDQNTMTFLCQDGTGLNGATDVAVSADGKSVYLVGAGGVAILDRNPSTGELAQKPGTAGCISDTGSGGACRDGTALVHPAAIAVSPNGRSVYAAAIDSDAVTVFDRDVATGALAQRAGAGGCTSDTGSGGACRDGAGLDGAWDVASSPDAKNAYVASRDASAIAIFDWSSPPSAPPVAADKVAPGVTGFSLSRKRFRVAGSSTPVSARKRKKSPKGTSFRFSLTEKANVRITIERALKGRKVGKLCKAPSRKLKKRRRCTRFKSAGTLTRKNRAAGRNTISFSGRIGRRKLKPGAYKATITATDPAGNRSKTHSARFTIVRR